MANGDPYRVTAEVAAIDQDARVDANGTPRVDMKWGTFPPLPTASVPSLGANQKATEVAIKRAAFKPDYTTNKSTRTVTDAVANATTTVTSSTATFVTGDVGARVTLVKSDGTGVFTSRIASRNSGTSVVLEDAAPYSATGCSLRIDKVGNSATVPAAASSKRLGTTVVQSA